MTAHNFIDLTNSRFGRLIVLSFGGQTRYRNAKWNCLCECGTSIVVSSGNLRNGNTKSCGCLQRDRVIEISTTHGKCYSSVYHTWVSMKQRCFDSAVHHYKYYGGRGITVCDRWLNSFENFYADMGDKPSPDHSIDRKNNYGNYEPSNCRWATATDQMHNRRVNHRNTTGISGVSKNNGKWLVSIGFESKRIYLYYGSDFFEACCRRKSAENKYWGVER